MQSHDRRRYDMLVRVRTFGATHDQLFPSTSAAHDAFTVIAAEVDRLTALDVDERLASFGARVGRKSAARQALTDSLTRAGSTVRVLARSNAQLDAQIQLPLPKDAVQLLTLARHFVASAAPFAAQLAAHGIPITELEERLAAFEQAVQDRRVRRDDRVKARAEIKASSRVPWARRRRSTSPPRTLSPRSVALAVWQHDRRLDYPPRSRRATGTVEQTVVAEPVAGTPPGTGSASANAV